MKYLVQYGEFKTSTIVDANSKEDAIRQVFEEGLTWGKDIDYDVLVIELSKGQLFKVDRNLKVRSI